MKDAFVQTVWVSKYISKLVQAKPFVQNYFAARFLPILRRQFEIEKNVRPGKEEIEGREEVQIGFFRLLFVYNSR